MTHESLIIYLVLHLNHARNSIDNRAWMMPLSQLFKDLEQDEWVDIPQGWVQGRTIFGGLTTAMMLHKAIWVVNDPQKRLLTVSVSFVAPVEEKPVKVTVEILRQGKSVTTIEARIWQNDRVMSILLASFGSERASVLNVQQQRQAPQFQKPEQLKILPYHQLMPQCYQNFDLAWAEGHYPCTASPQADFGGWFRFTERNFPQAKMTVPEFLALLDIWPAGAFTVLEAPAPGSSLSWYVTLLADVDFQRLDWFKYKVFTDHAENGYATEYAHIWDANDRLIAISRQTVTIFA